MWQSEIDRQWDRVEAQSWSPRTDATPLRLGPVGRFLAVALCWAIFATIMLLGFVIGSEREQKWCDAHPENTTCQASEAGR